jgi:hypothetical protein
MLMCNACGIYYKNHGRHRPVELAALPQRVVNFPRPSATRTAAPATARLGGSDDDATVAMEPLRPARRRVANPRLGAVAAAGVESEWSEDSDGGEGVRRRSQRPRRRTAEATGGDDGEWVQDAEMGVARQSVLAEVVQVPPIAYDSEEGEPSAASMCCHYVCALLLHTLPPLCCLTPLPFPPSDSRHSLPPGHLPSGHRCAGSDVSSVHVLDEREAERSRVELINRLVKRTMSADLDGEIAPPHPHPHTPPAYSHH